MKQYAVIHCQKGKGSGGGQGYHIDRDPNTPTPSDRSTRPEDLNREFAPDKFTQLSMPEAIAVRIKEGYTSNRAIRADTVRYVDTIMSGSHEQMKELEKNGQITEWAKQSQKLAEDMFGKENIVRFTLHMDERTPHIHCVFCSNYRRRTSFGQRNFIQEKFIPGTGQIRGNDEAFWL